MATGAYLSVIFLLMAWTLCLGGKGNDEGVLKVTTLTEYTVEGSYVEKVTGRGLHFISTTDSLSITTLEGQPLLTAGRSVGSMRLVSVGKDRFIQQKDEEGSTDYAVPASDVGGIMDIVPGTLEALVGRLQSVDGNVHSQKLQASTEELLTRSEVQLIERAAFALGGKGVTGLKYPSILPFYLATLQLQRLLTNSTSVDYPPSHLYSKHVSKRASCFETCPPCPNDNCLGMCGLACNCWRFLCGDCCYHLGCYDHDLCCRERFVQTACLFPFGFSCGSHYQC